MTAACSVGGRVQPTEQPAQFARPRRCRDTVVTSVTCRPWHERAALLRGRSCRSSELTCAREPGRRRMRAATSATVPADPARVLGARPSGACRCSGSLPARARAAPAGRRRPARPRRTRPPRPRAGRRRAAGGSAGRRPWPSLAGLQVDDHQRGRRVSRSSRSTRPTSRASPTRGLEGCSIATSSSSARLARSQSTSRVEDLLARSRSLRANQRRAEVERRPPLVQQRLELCQVGVRRRRPPRPRGRACPATRDSDSPSRAPRSCSSARSSQRRKESMRDGLTGTGRVGIGDRARRRTAAPVPTTRRDRRRARPPRPAGPARRRPRRSSSARPPGSQTTARSSATRPRQVAPRAARLVSGAFAVDRVELVEEARRLLVLAAHRGDDSRCRARVTAT